MSTLCIQSDKVICYNVSTYSSNISLMCSPVCSSTVIGCTYDLPSGIYNMYVYDIEEEGILSDDWAISPTNITITGLELTSGNNNTTISVIASDDNNRIITDGDIITALINLNLMENKEWKTEIRLFYSSGLVVDITDQLKLSKML